MGARREFTELLADAIAGSPRATVLAARSCQGAEAIARSLLARTPQDEIRSSGYVVDTLESALWSVARTGNFRNPGLLAVNLADDADTVAAVARQLAGAPQGLDGIPTPGWRASPGRIDSSRRDAGCSRHPPASGRQPASSGRAQRYSGAGR